MWLLKLHIGVSILCLLTFYGFKVVFRELFKQNGYLSDDNKGKKSFWIFFIPILNVSVVCLMLIMMTMTKDELTKWCEDHKKKKEI